MIRDEGVATPGPDVGCWAREGRKKEEEKKRVESLVRESTYTITEVGYWYFEPMFLSFKY
jgi:hypothetical protein